MSPCGRSSTSTSCPTSWTATSPRRFTRSSPPGLTPPPSPRGSLPYSTLSSSTRTPSSTWPTPSWSLCPSALSSLSSPLPSSAAKPPSNSSGGSRRHEHINQSVLPFLTLVLVTI